MVTKNSKYQSAMLPWPALAEKGKQIKVGTPELNLFYFEAGERNSETIILIHGLGDEADTWRHVITPLSENYHLYALDLPGFGRSEKPDVDYKPGYMIEKIIQFMNKLGITRAILMGSSLGGILAHQIAISHPDRVKGLILVGGSILMSGAMRDPSLLLMSLPCIGKWLYTRLRKNSDAAYASLKSVYYQLQEMPEDDRDFLYFRVNQRVWDDGQRRAYLSTLKQLTSWIKQAQADLPHQLKLIQAPTLIIRGAFDQLFSEASAEAVMGFQTNVSKTTIDVAGHLPQQEKPVAFLDIVSQWLVDNF
ncbi:MAG: alpha/beta hydrolase [Chloroflexi bacterium]|nr:alpha/beta hydrolase [Chloroflexota bacterium]